MSSTIGAIGLSRRTVWFVAVVGALALVLLVAALVPAGGACISAQASCVLDPAAPDTPCLDTGQCTTYSYLQGALGWIGSLFGR